MTEWLAAAAVVLTALLGLMGVLLGQLYARIARLEGVVTSTRDYNHRLWQWARAHLDLYYRHRVPGSPDPAPIPTEDDEA